MLKANQPSDRQDFVLSDCHQPFPLTHCRRQTVFFEFCQGMTAIVWQTGNEVCMPAARNAD